MPLPLSPKSGLGMKVTILPCFLAMFLTMYLYSSQLVRHGHQVVEAHVDLGLAAGGHFVVLRLDGDADCSRVSIISLRMSCSVSVGGTGK